MSMFNCVSLLTSKEVYDLITLLRTEVCARILRGDTVVYSDSDPNPSWFPQWITMSNKQKTDYLDSELEEYMKNK